MEEEATLGAAVGDGDGGEGEEAEWAADERMHRLLKTDEQIVSDRNGVLLAPGAVRACGKCCMCWCCGPPLFLAVDPCLLTTNAHTRTVANPPPLLPPKIQDFKLALEVVDAAQKAAKEAAAAANKQQAQRAGGGDGGRRSSGGGAGGGAGVGGRRVSSDGRGSLGGSGAPRGPRE